MVFGTRVPGVLGHGQGLEQGLGNTYPDMPWEPKGCVWRACQPTTEAWGMAQALGLATPEWIEPEPWRRTGAGLDRTSYVPPP